MSNKYGEEPGLHIDAGASWHCGVCGPRLDLRPPSGLHVACVGLLHLPISESPTRGGAASRRSQVTPHQVRWRRCGRHTHFHCRSRLWSSLRSRFLSLSFSLLSSLFLSLLEGRGSRPILFSSSSAFMGVSGIFGLFLSIAGHF